MPARPRRRKRAAKPRVPLPRQTGGAHKTARRVLPRKQKHKRPPGSDDE